MDDDIKGKAGAKNIFANKAGRARLLHRIGDLANGVRYLTANVDECVAGPDCIRGNDYTLNQCMRIRQHDRDVFAGTRLRFICIDHEVVRLAIILRYETPLHSGGEAGATTPAQPRILYLSDDRVRIHF